MKILFLCVHNSGRSQMAEAILNHVASQRGLAVRASSAGTSAGVEVNTNAMTALREIGVPVEGLHPKQLDQESIKGADRVITMGCGVEAEACPAKFIASEDWGLDDPAVKDLEAVRCVRDQIAVRVEALLGALKP